MIWLMRRFKNVDYVPYQNKVQAMWVSAPQHADEFIMVGVKTGQRLEQDCYVGLPSNEQAARFDGFETVEESKLPAVVDTVLWGNLMSDQFTSRFNVRE